MDQAVRLVEIAKKEAPQANLVIEVDQDTPAYVVEDLYDAVRSLLTVPPCIATDDEA
jgi:biopolymer transport protein ExbD